MIGSGQMTVPATSMLSSRWGNIDGILADQPACVAGSASLIADDILDILGSVEPPRDRELMCGGSCASMADDFHTITAATGATVVVDSDEPAHGEGAIDPIRSAPDSRAALADVAERPTTGTSSGFVGLNFMNGGSNVACA